MLSKLFSESDVHNKLSQLLSEESDWMQQQFTVLLRSVTTRTQKQQQIQSLFKTVKQQQTHSKTEKHDSAKRHKRSETWSFKIMIEFLTWYDHDVHILTEQKSKKLSLCWMQESWQRLNLIRQDFIMSTFRAHFKNWDNFISQKAWHESCTEHSNSMFIWSWAWR